MKTSQQAYGIYIVLVHDRLSRGVTIDGVHAAERTDSASAQFLVNRID
jgi:hypothetical protein